MKFLPLLTTFVSSNQTEVNSHFLEVISSLRKPSPIDNPCPPQIVFFAISISSNQEFFKMLGI